MSVWEPEPRILVNCVDVNVKNVFFSFHFSHELTHYDIQEQLWIFSFTQWFPSSFDLLTISIAIRNDGRHSLEL